MTESIDYIVIGGGSAGCVLASRLTENPKSRVLLIEAGADTPPEAVPDDIASVYPLSYYNAANMWAGLRATWRGESARQVGFQQARVMGGGSSVMGMVALRGLPDDYDGWAADGADGWSWSDVLPFFRKLERDMDFDGPLHGDSGPTPIRRTPRADWPPLTREAAAFSEKEGFAFVADMNGDFRDGFGAVPMSNWPDRRASSAICYLTDEVRRRPNLEIRSNTRVARIIVENDSAKGVEVGRNGSRETITAANVIVCAGAIHSPHLLQLSGLGPADSLRRAGVDVVRDLPGVGANLQNHAILYLGAMLRPAARQSIALKTHPTACFRLTAPGSDLAGDISVNVQSKTSWNALGRLVANVAPVLWRPFSTGRVGINPGDRFAEPEVAFNLLSDERDLPRMLAATRLGLRLFRHLTRAGIAGRPYFVKFDDRIRRLNAYSFRNRVMAGAAYGAASLAPGLLDHMLGLFTDQSVDPTAIVDDDAGLSSAIKQNVAGMFHPVGTCRIGRATDPQAVVSPKGKVHRLERLYVVDSSVMPSVPRGNTNLPTLMLAEKLAQEIA